MTVCRRCKTNDSYYYSRVAIVSLRRPCSLPQVLKAHLLKHNKAKLPKPLLQQLDPMERQQLEEA